MPASTLSPLQKEILCAATQRPDGAILPIPSTMDIAGGALSSVLKSLIKKGWVAEQPATNEESVWRRGKNLPPVTLVLTARGYDLVGAPPPSEKKPKGASSKHGTLIALLSRPVGANMAEMMKVTGWQAHSVRGAISGALRKKQGFIVVREALEDRGSVYRIVGEKR